MPSWFWDCLADAWLMLLSPVPSLSNSIFLRMAPRCLQHAHLDTGTYLLCCSVSPHPPGTQSVFIPCFRYGTQLAKSEIHKFSVAFPIPSSLLSSSVGSYLLKHLSHPPILNLYSPFLFYQVVILSPDSPPWDHRNSLYSVPLLPDLHATNNLA